MDFLEQLYGLGETMARELYRRLLREKLITKQSGPVEVMQALHHPSVFPDLPASTQVDILERPDKSIPRDVLKVLDKTLHSRIKGIKYDVAGSYKRQKTTSRDADIVISRGSWKTSLSVWKSFMKQMHGSRVVRFHKPFAGGDDKLSVLVDVHISQAVLGEIKKAHPDILAFHKTVWKIKADIFVASPNEYIFTRLYATGSGGFNVMMRAQAKRKGMMLNQRGLFRGKKRIPAKTEKEVFKILGIGYRTPQQRS